MVPLCAEKIHMSRRKVMAARGKTGRILLRNKDAELLSPTEARRLIDLASAGLRDAIWSTTAGQLYARGKIAASEYAAANGSSVDPDTLTGIKEAKRHERATLNYLEARDALRLSGAIAERVVTSVCIAGELPAGITELNALRNGLRALSAQWHSRRKPR
jgi:hypothetical protein